MAKKRSSLSRASLREDGRMWLPFLSRESSASTRKKLIWFSAVGALWLFLSIATARGGQENQPLLSDSPSSIEPTDDGESSKLLHDRRVIAKALREAGAEFNVPLPILQGIAFVQSRWGHIIPHGPADTPPAYGVMGLRDDDWFGHSLVEAAALIGETPEQLKTDPISNIRGGAALLAALADEEQSAGEIVDQRLETWKRVVERYSGIRSLRLTESFALDVFRIIRDGYHEFGTDIDAHPTFDMSIFSEEIREPESLKKKEPVDILATVLAASGYPGADWCGPEPDSSCPPPIGNYETGRSGNAISLVIIHTIEGSAQSALDWFQNPASKSSAHYIVKQDGAIWQVVSDQDTAYHAGNYTYNLRSIGIELEGWADGNPDLSWQTTAQYSALKGLINWLRSQYGNILLDRAHIIGHNQVPGVNSSGCAGPAYWGGCRNHHDPGAWWSWRRLMNDLGRSPTYTVLTVQASCSIIALPQSGAPYITSVWPGQKFVAYDSYGGYYLIFLSGQETAQPYLGSGEYHWDGWLPSSCVSIGASATQLEVTGVFPSRLNIRDGTSSAASVIAKTIDGKKYVATGNTQIGFDGYPWYEFNLAWDTGARTGWSSGQYLSPIGGPTPTLSVSLTANPSSGSAPLNTNLTADVSGSATGSINYTFWWNCNDSGTNVGGVMAACGSIPTPAAGSCASNANGMKCDGVTDDPKIVNHDYSSADTYTAKVIAEQGSALPDEERVPVTVCATNTFYRDADGDGYGNAALSTQACSAPPGYVANNSDCNDGNANTHPGATEVCNGVDDNCNGQIDEGVKSTFYRDADGDEYGTAATSTQACSAPPGYVANSTDCNDANGAIHPGATELCNGVDDDCDGQVDEGVQSTFYRDADGDGYGNASNSTQACSAPSGYVANSADCNDANGAIHPGATELCNGVDDNCNGQIDEGVKSTFYQDGDGDSYGNAGASTQACSTPTGYVTNSTDCNDTNAAIHPGAVEICGDGIDQDCNGADTACPVPLLTILTPNGGETWTVGTTQTIQWTSSGVSGDVKIEFSQDGGQSWTPLFSDTSNDGAQSWSVTGPATTQARIRMSSVTAPSVTDSSDANFTTVQQNGSCLYSGTIVRVTTVPGNSPSTIYFRPSALSPAFFSSTTSDAKLIHAALHALRRQTKVTVAGTAAVCPAPTAGGNIGTMNFLIVNP